MLPVARTRECAQLFDLHPRTGLSIEVFFADRTMETFGRCGAGWFWQMRRRGFAPEGPPSGPFSTTYAAYRNAMDEPAVSQQSRKETRGCNGVATDEWLIRSKEHRSDFFKMKSVV